MDQSIVDEYLVSRPSKDRANGTIYVTDLVKPCLRQAYLDIKSPKQYDASTLRIFEAGRMIEDWWIALLKNTPGYSVLGQQLATRWPINGGSIHGRVDALCQHGDGALVVHEVKSAKSLAYMKGEAKPEHVAQLQFYLNVLNVEWGQVDYLDKSVMLQGGGDAARVDQSFRVQRDPAAFAALVSRANLLLVALRADELPMWTQGWQCDYCLHKEGCK